MGAGVAGVLFLVAGLSEAVALLFDMIAVSSNVWHSGLIHYRGKTQPGTMGLWKVCTSIGSCGDIESDDVTSWLNACRAFGILSILGITAGLALTAGARLSGDQKFFGLVAFIAAIAAGLLVLLPIVVYSSEVGSVEYGYSFVLMVMAFILCVAAAVLLFIGRILAVD